MCKADPNMIKVPLEKASKQDFYRELHKIADEAEPEVRKAILNAFDEISKDASISKIQQAVRENDLDKVLIALGVGQANMQRALSPISNRLRRAFEDAADRVLDLAMPKKVKIGMRFDALNPRAIEYIRDQGANLVTNVTKGTREGIQTIMLDSFQSGIPPRAAAERIKDLVGLLPKHAKAVANMRSLLISEGVRPDLVAKRTKAYAERLLRWRAMNIARTETMLAANNGQHALWDQAIENGLIETSTTFKKWIITPDDRLCPICRPIPGDNPKVPINGSFQTSKGLLFTPPAHPQCRCAMGLSFGV